MLGQRQHASRGVEINSERVARRERDRGPVIPVADQGIGRRRRRVVVEHRVTERPDRTAGCREHHVGKHQLVGAGGLRARSKQRSQAAGGIAIAGADLGDVCLGRYRRGIRQHHLQRSSVEVVDALRHVLNELVEFVEASDGRLLIENAQIRSTVVASEPD